jgi:hypothetical protein
VNVENPIAAATAATEAAPASPPSGLTLDTVAQGFGYKSFKGIKNPADQAAVTAAFERFVKAESPSGTTAPPFEATPAPTPGRFSAEDFRRPPPAVAATETAGAPASNRAVLEAQQALRDAMVESGTAPLAEPPSAAAVGETMHQLNRANAASNIAQSLHEHGFSAAQFQKLRKLNMPMLQELANRLKHDVSDPATWEQVGIELKKLSSKKATAVGR